MRSEAEADAKAAAAYIAEHASAEFAEHWLEGLRGAIKSLAFMPLRCGLAVEHGCVPGVEFRQHLYRSHRIIFFVQNSEVHVLYVRHAARRALDLSLLREFGPFG